MYELSEIGNLVVVIAGALGSLLLIVFKSRCKSICFGCIVRDVINSDNEDEPTVPPTSSEQVPLTNP
jgi:hypothetical protein